MPGARRLPRGVQTAAVGVKDAAADVLKDRPLNYLTIIIPT